MEFTEGFPTAFGIGGRISPNGRHVACLAKRETAMLLHVHSISNGMLERRFTVPSLGPDIRPTFIPAKIDRLDLSWSPDSEKIALINYSRASVWTFDLKGDLDGPISVIQENQLLGIDRIRWTPTSDSFLISLSHRVRG